MLSTTDKTIIDHNTKDNQQEIPKSIVIGYNGDTSIYAFTMLSGVHDTSFALNNMPSKINWTYDRWNCSYAFTKCSSALYFHGHGTKICSACYEFYKSATQVSKREYDIYIQDILYVNKPSTPKFISGFTKNNKYFICLKTHKTNYFVIIRKKEGELTQEEKHEVIRRKYIWRLIMFAQCDLIKDIIGLIAVVVIG
jgi:hypothetical protein